MRLRKSIIIFATVILLPIGAMSEPMGSASEEEPVDLDALDEDDGGEAAGSAAFEEILPPGTMSVIEIEREPALALIGLLVLIPAIAMFVPSVRRMRKTHPFKQRWIANPRHEGTKYA